ncbi:hypothetical protein VPH35_117816 [Triticum aestivum]
MERGKLPQHNPGKLEPSCRGGAGGRREGGTEKRAAEIFCQSRHQQGFAGDVGTVRRRRSSRRVVDSWGQRSSSGCYEPNYDPNDSPPNTESCDESIAYSDEESVSKRKKLLEDALFVFLGRRQSNHSRFSKILEECRP